MPDIQCGCGRKVRFPETMIGKEAACPSCNRSLWLIVNRDAPAKLRAAFRRVPEVEIEHGDPEKRSDILALGGTDGTPTPPGHSQQYSPHPMDYEFSKMVVAAARVLAAIAVVVGISGLPIGLLGWAAEKADGSGTMWGIAIVSGSLCSLVSGCTLMVLVEIERRLVELVARNQDSHTQ